MGQEFFINSQQLQDKVDQLLPSQGGLGAGFDLSASTQIIPIVDLTESAEGSNLREDLQRSFSLTSITHTQVSNTTTTLVNNTGYFRVFGTVDSQSGGFSQFQLTDGVTTKSLLVFNGNAANSGIDFFDFVVFLSAGDSLTATSSAASQLMQITTRQIADIDGNLVNP